jgi:hypothetical protein
MPSVTDLQSLTTLQASAAIDKITKDWISTVHQLQDARDKLGRLIRSEHMLDYCGKEMSVCENIMDDIRIGLLGVAILNLSFCIGAIGGLLAPRVIKRWLKDEERMIIFSGLNLTDV